MNAQVLYLDLGYVLSIIDDIMKLNFYFPVQNQFFNQSNLQL